MYINGQPGRMARVEGESYLFFSGFAYLGMPALETFQRTVTEGLRRYGSVFPSSRNSNTRSALYEKLEAALSEHTASSESASFSSGYLAAQAAVTFAARNSRLLYPYPAHPSLVCTVGESPVVREMAALIRFINQSDEACTLVLESVHPLTGRRTDFTALKEITRPVRVIVDDSHGIGILGEQGEGVRAFLPDAAHLHYLLCYSLSKAYSCQGGGVSGSAADIAAIKAVAPYSASTPMSPAFAFAWLESRQLFKAQLSVLRRNMAYFQRQSAGLRELQFDPLLPVCALPDDRAYEMALMSRILLSAFRYPTPEDPLKTRIVLNALHTLGDLDRLLVCLRQAGSR